LKTSGPELTLSTVNRNHAALAGHSTIWNFAYTHHLFARLMPQDYADVAVPVDVALRHTLYQAEKFFTFAEFQGEVGATYDREKLREYVGNRISFTRGGRKL
jgi:hypothetical protein